MSLDYPSPPELSSDMDPLEYLILLEEYSEEVVRIAVIKATRVCEYEEMK